MHFAAQTQVHKQTSNTLCTYMQGQNGARTEALWRAEQKTCTYEKWWRKEHITTNIWENKQKQNETEKIPS